MRFNGDYMNFVNILKEELGLEYKPHFRSPEHRELLRKANLGKRKIK